VRLTTLPCKRENVEKPPRNSAGFCGGGQGLSLAVEPRKEEERFDVYNWKAHDHCFSTDDPRPLPVGGLIDIGLLILVSVTRLRSIFYKNKIRQLTTAAVLMKRHL
jgi:hypothetical protein